MRILRTSPAIPSTCFFCGTKPSKPPRNPRSFKCQECSCWNRYDENGEIMSDEPAMHDESLNASSFAKKASPSKNRFPKAANTQSLFCRTCLTNQTLLVNLLSNYLPSSEDPSYAKLLAEMPAYKTALEARYPPVCKECEFSVEEAIKTKEHMARTSALGSWLKRSQDVGSKRSAEQQNARREMRMWRVRGGLWVLTLVSSIGINLAGSFEYDINKLWIAVVLPLWSVVSVLWAFWDPTWSIVRMSHLQGRGFTVAGRQLYIYCQMLSWIIRLFISIVLCLTYFEKLHDSITPNHLRVLYIASTAAELILGIIWISKLRIKRPPKIRLLDSKSQSNAPSRATSVAPSTETLFNSLSFTPQSPPPTKHVFGQPSFPSPIRESDVSPEDMMDWTPVNSRDKVNQAKETWIRPQRFFPPEQPTGLEELFKKATKLDEDTNHEPDSTHGWKRIWYYQQYQPHIDKLLAGIVLTVFLGLGYIFLRQSFLSKPPQITFVHFNDP